MAAISSSRPCCPGRRRTIPTGRRASARSRSASTARRWPCGSRRRRGGYDFNRRFRLPEPLFAASGGGVPLMLASGTLIGTAGVSGLPDVEDHRLITTALRELLGRPA
ncbi:heme-binding protein [Inquilinus sp. NPDC058860]|uniref:heme-binding protein n=1 Tax=Inquilinus sp. NPDC058860 TaxID=3346652 RepID=UPI0036CF6292